jgi:hypothetical protein
VRTDIIVENTNAFEPQAQPQYTATLTSGSASYTSPALTQYAYTRWHKVLWWNNAQPQVYLQQDTQYIQNSMAVSRYMPLTPDESFLASLRQSCAPLDRCDVTAHMGDVGAQPTIGPLPRWSSVYILDPDIRAYNWMLANTDALGTYSFHYRDQATGFPLSIQKHPHVSITAWDNSKPYPDDLLPNCVDNAVVTGCGDRWYTTGNPDTWDNAHQPAMAYVPYMVTGDYYYMSELAFSASMNLIYPNWSYRGLSQGLIDSAQGYAAYGQVRGKAWVLRSLVDAAWLLPDHYPLKAEFTASVNNSLAQWNQKYTNNPNASPLHVLDDGAVYSINGGNNNAMAPWQHNFLTWSVNHAAELGFAGAAPFRDWLAKFEISLMTDWQSNPTQGYCWLEASAYNVQVKNPDGSWVPSFAAAYKATFPTLVGLACNTPAMIAAMAKLPGNPNPGQIGEMYGYAYSPTGFPANLQIGLAAATDTSLPNAQQAWATFASRSVQPTGSYTYANYPNFAVIPRSVQAGPVPPPTNPGLPPTNTTAPIVATPPGLRAPVDYPPLPPAGGQTPVAAGNPAHVEPTTKSAQTTTSPTRVGSREVLPGRVIYLGAERFFRSAYQAATHFASWLASPLAPNYRPAVQTSVAPASRARGNPTPAASQPATRATAAAPAVKAPIQQTAPAICFLRCADVVDRR